MSQIKIHQLHFTYEGTHVPVFQNLNLQLDTSWKLGLVGRNGRGKTTLLHLLDGTLAGEGTISCGEPRCYAPKPVKDSSATTRQILAQSAPQTPQWQLLRELSHLDLKEDILDRPFATLSGGEQTRALLAAVCADETCYLMLDEPTNHLDRAGRAQVARYLQGLNRGFLLVSHDRTFLDGCVDHILALNQTGPELIRGDFSTWFREKTARDRRELAHNETLKGEIKRLHQAARRASDWSEQVEHSKYATRNSGLRPDRGFIGHKSAKMMKRAKSIEHRQEEAIEEKSSLLQDLERTEPLKLFPMTHRSSPFVELKNVGIAYSNRDICKDISFTINPGDRVCLDGGNGSGKTSLLRLLLGEALPHTGLLHIASQTQLSYMPQKIDQLSGTLLDWAKRQGIDTTLLLSILRKLDFSRALFECRLEDYSAGQKKKVMLAGSLCQRAHLYIWDEPLNYIDLFSRVQIEQLILEYQPTILFVEHDKSFQHNIATKVIAL